MIILLVITTVIANSIFEKSKNFVKEFPEHDSRFGFTPLEIMPRCFAAGLDFRIIPAGFNAPLEFLTGFTLSNSY